jgi:RHS repeat-associated protein
VSSSAGYGFTINYVTDNPGNLLNQDAPQTNWYVKTGATFSNSAVPCDSSCPSIAYPTPPATYTFSDALSRQWTVTGSSIKRPGEASPSTVATFTGGVVSSVVRDGVTTTYSRSVAGNVSTMVVTDPLGHSKTITGDIALHRIKSVQDELGHTTSYLYDTFGRLTRITLPEGNYVEYSYDGRGNILTTTVTPKSGSGLLPISASATYPSTCTNQKTCNQPTSTTDPKGNVTDYTYNGTHGGVVTATRPPPALGLTRPETRYSYTSIASASGDPVYQLTGVSACQTGSGCTGLADETKATIAYNPNLLPVSITRANGTGTLSVTDSSTYDPAGNMVTQDGPLSTADITRYRYDADRELTGVMHPDPDGTGPLNIRAVQLTYRPDGQVSKQELGTITGTTSPSWSTFAASQTVDIGFDGNSRPVTSKLSAGGTDYALTQTSYDALGRTDCTAVRMNTGVYGSLPGACTLSTQGANGPDRISQTVYDNASQPIQLKVAVGTADAAIERSLAYTSNGMLASLTDGENNKTTYVYEGFDRLSQTQYPNATKGSGTSNTSDYEQLTYDLNSNVTQYRARNGGTISFGYDNLDRVTSKTSASLPAVNYGYDLLDRMLSATFATGGQGITNGYDALGRLTSNSSNVGGTAHPLNYAYDAAGRRTRITWWDGFKADYMRLVTGEISQLSDISATGVTTTIATFGYDDLRRRTSLTRPNSTSTSYSYDAVSRLTSIFHDMPNPAYDLKIGTPASPIAYNPAFQIVSEGRDNDTYSFTGNANTNIAYVANGLNQGKQADATVYGFDANGNLTSDGWFTFTYDIENKLVSALPINAGVRTLSYDPLNRLDLYNPGTARRFIYDGDEVVAELDSSGNIIGRYVRGDAPDEIITGYTSSDPTARGWYHLDNRNSVIAVTDPNGVVTVVNRYGEYGQPQGGNYGTFQYTGQMWLGEIGVYNYKARMYWPNERPGGRFMQTDPVGPEDSPNLYAYPGDDPINLTDPEGLQCDENTWVCGERQPFGSGFAGSGTSGSAVGGFIPQFLRSDNPFAGLVPTPAVQLPGPIPPSSDVTCNGGNCDVGGITIHKRRPGSTRWMPVGGRFVQDPAWRNPWYDKPVTYGFAGVALAPVSMIGAVESGALAWEGASVGYAMYGRGMIWQVRLFRDVIKVRRDINKPINHYNIEIGSWNIHIPPW